MLLAARLVAALLGIGMLVFVLGGFLAYPQFTVPDAAIGGLMLVAAILPSRLAPLAIMLAAAFACGVFSVAVFNQLHLGVPVNPPLIGTVAATLAALGLAAGTHRRWAQPARVNEAA